MRAATIVMIVFATASTPGCVAREAGSGSDDTAGGDGSGDGAHDDADAPASASGADTQDDAPGGMPGADRPIVGAALLEDGLCPWAFSETPALTLQFSAASFVCNAGFWGAALEAGEYPTWYAELYLPFDEPGTYDISQFDVRASINVIDLDTGGGGSGVWLTTGVVEIEYLDETTVAGTVSGVGPLTLNSVDYDINGAFEAVRCTPEEWLDLDDYDPGSGGQDPACTLPD